MSQNKQILKYLQTHKRGISPIDALQKFGCFRLTMTDTMQGIS